MNHEQGSLPQPIATIANEILNEIDQSCQRIEQQTQAENELILGTQRSILNLLHLNDTGGNVSGSVAQSLERIEHQNQEKKQLIIDIQKAATKFLTKGDALLRRLTQVVDGIEIKGPSTKTNASDKEVPAEPVPEPTLIENSEGDFSRSALSKGTSPLDSNGLRTQDMNIGEEDELEKWIPDEEMESEAPEADKNSRLAVDNANSFPKRNVSPPSPKTDSTALEEVAVDELVARATQICSTFFHDNGGDPEEAFALYTEAANRHSFGGLVGAAKMMASGALSLGTSKKVDKNETKAIELVEKALLLKPNNPDALNLRGDLWLRNKRNIIKSYARARALYLKSAASGNVGGLYRNGKLYFLQMRRALYDAVKRRACEKAVSVLTAAAEKGSGEAACLLASIYENEYEDKCINEVIQGITSSGSREAQAVSLYRKSMDVGCAQGTNDFATCFEVAYGGVLASFDAAKDLYEMAFRNGHAAAAANLGMLYEFGGGGAYKNRLSMQDALKWYTAGNKMGCPTATHCLGKLYDSGIAVKRDAERARQLFGEAVVLGKNSGAHMAHIDNSRRDFWRMGYFKVLTSPNLSPQAFHELEKSIGKTAMSKKLATLNNLFATILRDARGRKRSSYSVLKSVRERAEKALGSTNYKEIIMKAQGALKKAKRSTSRNSAALLRCIVGKSGASALGLRIPNS